MTLAHFLKLCKAHNARVQPGRSSVDVHQDTKVGETLVITLTPFEGFEVEAFWMGTQCLEEELETFEPSEFAFEHSVKRLMDKLYHPTLKRLT